MPVCYILTVRAELILKMVASATLALMLIGCKPGDSAKSRFTTNGMPSPETSHSTMVTPSQQPGAALPVIACFGDSLTAGLGLDYEESYPADLQSHLDELGYHYRVVNAGISGETTKDALARVDKVIAMKPAIVVVEFGGNDGLRGVPITESKANLDKVLAALHASGTQVALAGITLPPQYGPEYIRQFNAMYPTLAKKYGVRMIPFVLQGAYGTTGDIQRDGIHPTAAGAKVVAQNVLGLIQPMLKK